MDTLTAGLVRVVAKDGSVWLVPPARAAWYAALDSAKVTSRARPPVLVMAPDRTVRWSMDGTVTAPDVVYDGWQARPADWKPVR